MVSFKKENIEKLIIEKTNMTESELKSRVRDKIDQLSGLVSEEGALRIIANEFDINVIDSTPGNVLVKDIEENMGTFSIDLKVLEIYRPIKSFSRGDSDGKVLNVLGADDTGKIRVSLWDKNAQLMDEKGESGMIIRIPKCSAKFSEYSQKVELSVGGNSEIVFNPENAKEISVSATSEFERKKISEIKEDGESLELVGTIVDVYMPRFFPQDKTTRKKVIEKDDGKFYLPDGTQSGEIEKGYVTTFIVDDGSDTLNVVCWKKHTEILYNMSEEEILEKEEKDLPWFQKKNEKLIGTMVKLLGETKHITEYNRFEFKPKKIIMDLNPKEELERYSSAEKTASNDIKPTSDATNENETMQGVEKIENSTTSVSNNSSLSDDEKGSRSDTSKFNPEKVVDKPINESKKEMDD